MRLSLRVVVLPALVGLTLPQPALAQGETTATLQVSARVAPSCSITAEAPLATDGAATPSVRVVCGRSGLRALRVLTDSGDGGTPAIGLPGRQVPAGGEVIFTVPVLLGTVASRSPVAGLGHANEPATVVMTLHF